MVKRYRRRPGVNETPVEDELFLIAGDSGDIFHLDQLAMSIWRAMAEPLDQAALLTLFTTAFPDTDGQDIRRDLDAALAVLLAGELIEICD